MKSLPPLLLGLLALGFAACSDGGSGTQSPASLPSGPEQARAYYKEHPEFFRFASPEDLPSDLQWEDGSGQPVFASPDAIRGGTIRSFALSFPPTIRYVGPDSNHSLRGLYFDDNVISLIERHPDTKRFYPGLACEWAVSEDQTTVYYRLDPEARFSDGEPVTADDFFFLFFFMQSEYITAPWYNDFYSKFYSGITRFDDHTIAIELSQPFPEPLEFASVRPVPEHFYQDFGPSYTEDYQWKFEPTTGPYEIRTEDIKHGERLTLTRVENWWADQKKYFRNRFNPDKRVVTVVRDLDIAFKRFAQGDFDMFSLTLPEFWYEKSQGEDAFAKNFIRRITFYNEKPRPSTGIWINEARPLLANRDIRLGLQHAIDFDYVIATHFRGDFARLRTESDGFGELSHPTLTARPFDLDKAGGFFAKAGFVRRGPDGILRNANGERLEVTVSAAEGPNADFLPILQQQARKAGLLLNVEVLEPTLFYRKVMEKQHDLALMGWNSSLPYPRFWEGFHSENAYEPQTDDVTIAADPSSRTGMEQRRIKPQTNNITTTADPELDVLIDNYRFSRELEEKTRLAHQLQELVHERAVFIPGYYIPFYRVGAWRWVRFPEAIDSRISDGPGMFSLYWIDPEIRATTEAAIQSGTALPADDLVSEKWKQD